MIEEEVCREREAAESAVPHREYAIVSSVLGATPTPKAKVSSAKLVLSSPYGDLATYRMRVGGAGSATENGSRFTCRLGYRGELVLPPTR